jgi:hypothetical protein
MVFYRYLFKLYVTNKSILDVVNLNYSIKPIQSAMAARGTERSISIKQPIINFKKPLSILTPEVSCCSIIIVLLFCTQYKDIDAKVL